MTVIINKHFNYFSRVFKKNLDEEWALLLVCNIVKVDCPHCKFSCRKLYNQYLRKIINNKIFINVKSVLTHGPSVLIHPLPKGHSLIYSV